MSRLTDASKQAKETFGRLSNRQKIAMATAVVLTLGALIWIIVAASSTPYRVLFNELPPENLAQVVEALEGAQIDYEISGESTISVPEDKVHEARILLAGNGMLDFGGAGFELFDESDFGMTAFTQKVNYQRAMENELARTIGHIESIKQARVHLVMPEDALFKEDQKEPSASVVLTMRGGRPSQDNIQSIRYLVSSAVPGLEANQVTILDNKGHLLAQANSQHGGGLDMGGGLNAGGDLEEELQQSVLELLEPIVGAGKVRARVRVEMDNSQEVETVELYDPDKVAVRSEQRSEQSNMTGARNAAGAAGAISNLPGGPGATGGDASSQGTSSNEIVNYDISKTTRQTTRAPQRIRRISVAVVVDEGALADVAGLSTDELGEEGVDAALGLQMERITGLVQNVVGADEQRGDEVLVSLETFAPVSEEVVEEESFWSSPGFLNGLLRYGLPLLVLVLVFFFVIRPLLKTLTGPVEEAELVGIEDVDGSGGAQVALSEEAQKALEGPKEFKDKLRTEVLELGKSDVDRMSKVISQWIRIGSAQAGRG